MAGLSAALGRGQQKPLDFDTIFPAEKVYHASLQQRVAHRSEEEQLDLLRQLTTNAASIGVDVITLGTVNDLGGAMAVLLDEMDLPSTVVAWYHPCLTDIGLKESLADLGIELIQPGAMKGALNPDQGMRWRQAAARADVGITIADYCIAETATLVMRNRPGQPRSASLLPEVHAAVIALDQIIECPAELFALMAEPSAVESSAVTNCMTWVSGNSKSGDIEAVLVPGVHGPKRVVIYVLTGTALPESAKMELP